MQNKHNLHFSTMRQTAECLVKRERQLTSMPNGRRQHHDLKDDRSLLSSLAKSSWVPPLHWARPQQDRD
jgi:hypothetical protein